MNQKVILHFDIINECCCFLMGFSLNSDLFKPMIKQAAVADQKMETVRKIKAEKQVWKKDFIRTNLLSGDKHVGLRSKQSNRIGNFPD